MYILFHKSDCYLSDVIVIVGQLFGVDIQPHRVHCSLWYNGYYESFRTSMTWVGVEYDTTYDPTEDDTLTGMYRLRMHDTKKTHDAITHAIYVLDRTGVRSTTFTFLRALFGVTGTMVCCTYVAALVGVELHEPTPNELLRAVSLDVKDGWELA